MNPETSKLEPREGTPPEFPARLSVRLRVALGTILVIVLAGGGLAVFLAASISHTNTLIRQEYSHALGVSDLHLTFHDMVAAIEDAETSGVGVNLLRIQALRATLARRLEAVVAAQYGEPVPTDAEREAELLAELQRMAAELQSLTARLSSTGQGGRPSADTLARVEAISDRGVQVATSLVDLHHDGVRQLLVTSQERLRLILSLYIVLLVGGVASIVLAGLIANRWIVAPVRRLAQAAEYVAAGRLEARVPVRGRDEVGQLSHTFNVMTERLQAHERGLFATQTQLRRKMSEIQALYRIGSEISGHTKLDQILEWVAKQARELLRADLAAICLVSPDGDHLIPRAQSGPEEVFADADRAIPLVLPDGARAEPCATALELFHPGRIQASLTTPLRPGASMIGVLVIATLMPREFSADDRGLAAGLASHAAIAVDNARLYEEMQNVAALKERRRLAREIHDGLAQTLGLLHLKLHQLQSRLPQVDTATMSTAAKELTTLAESAYEEARQSIFGLRTAASPSMGFVPTLTQYLQEFSAQHAVPVELDAPEDLPLRLSLTTEAQLVRIIQEALANIRKHAAASRARIRLRRQNDLLRVCIEDDGRGWDLTASPSGPHHVGLDSMRERAESLGGRLQIVTAPGRGTRITAEVPLGETR